MILAKISNRWQRAAHQKFSFFGRLVMVSLVATLFVLGRALLIMLNTELAGEGFGAILLQFIATGFIGALSLMLSGIIITSVSWVLSWVIFGDGEIITNKVLNFATAFLEGFIRIVKFVTGPKPYGN